MKKRKRSSQIGGSRAQWSMIRPGKIIDKTLWNVREITHTHKKRRVFPGTHDQQSKVTGIQRTNQLWDLAPQIRMFNSEAVSICLTVARPTKVYG